MSHVPCANVVRILMFVMVWTRPDTTHAMGFLSMYMSKPGKEHWTTIKRVCRYLWGTSNYEIFYQGRPRHHKEIDIQGFFGENLARYIDHRIFASGYVFNLLGGEISWMSKK